MRKIIVPTDFSDNALNALKYATMLFKYERCQFYIIHAYADEVYDHAEVVDQTTLERIENSVLEFSDDELGNISSQLEEFSPNPRHNYQYLSLFGNLVDEVDELVDKENIDIIVMGTRGKTDDRKLTFGSNAIQVIKYVKCPVLLIPKRYGFTSPKRILFPSNYMVPYKKRELKLLSTIAKSFRSVIDFLYITDFEKLSVRQKYHQVFIKEHFHDIEINFITAPLKIFPEAILNFVKDQKTDLVVMVNSRHSYLETVLNKSSIDEIGLHIKVPFLVLQNMFRIGTR